MEDHRKFRTTRKSGQNIDERWNFHFYSSIFCKKAKWGPRGLIKFVKIKNLIFVHENYQLIKWLVHSFMNRILLVKLLSPGLFSTKRWFFSSGYQKLDYLPNGTFSRPYRASFYCTQMHRTTTNKVRSKETWNPLNDCSLCPSERLQWHPSLKDLGTTGADT